MPLPITKPPSASTGSIQTQPNGIGDEAHSNELLLYKQISEQQPELAAELKARRDVAELTLLTVAWHCLQNGPWPLHVYGGFRRLVESGIISPDFSRPVKRAVRSRNDSRAEAYFSVQDRMKDAECLDLLEAHGRNGPPAETLWRFSIARQRARTLTNEVKIQIKTLVSYRKSSGQLPVGEQGRLEELNRYLSCSLSYSNLNPANEYVCGLVAQVGGGYLSFDGLQEILQYLGLGPEYNLPTKGESVVVEDHINSFCKRVFKLSPAWKCRTFLDDWVSALAPPRVGGIYIDTDVGKYKLVLNTASKALKEERANRIQPEIIEEKGAAVMEFAKDYDRMRREFSTFWRIVRKVADTAVRAVVPFTLMAAGATIFVLLGIVSWPLGLIAAVGLTIGTIIMTKACVRGRDAW